MERFVGVLNTTKGSTYLSLSTPSFLPYSQKTARSPYYCSFLINLRLHPAPESRTVAKKVKGDGGRRLHIRPHQKENKAIVCEQCNKAALMPYPPHTVHKHKENDDKKAQETHLLYLRILQLVYLRNSIVALEP